MKKLTLEIPDRTRKYGYIYWSKRSQDEVRSFFGQRKTVEVILDGLYIGEKLINFEYCRISIGPGKARNIPDKASEIVLQFRKDGRLEIICQ